MGGTPSIQRTVERSPTRASDTRTSGAPSQARAAKRRASGRAAAKRRAARRRGGRRMGGGPRKRYATWLRGVMKHSAVARLAVPAVLVGLDAASRLALPAALLALSRGLADVAVVASFGSVLASMTRGLLLGYWTERAVIEIWRRTLDAARGQFPATLELRD